MLKKFFMIFIFFILILLLLFATTSFKQSIVVVPNNHKKSPIKLEIDKYKDRFCNMDIKDLKYSAQAILPNGDTLFFDDIGCLILWLKSQKNKKKIVLWVWGKDKNNYINARKAWYSLKDLTPMNYGFGAYEHKQNGYIDFDTVKIKMDNQETMANPKIRKKLLGKN